MILWAVIFFIFALIAGFLGFSGLFIAEGIARLLFLFFLIVFLIFVGQAFIGRRTRRRGPPPPPPPT